ncbi:MAG: hypothetical protein HUU35_11050, partial [Armatimonadetes bacterium]|nr:hypothetical protein [Armatimonadota bacterium]
MARLPLLVLALLLSAGLAETLVLAPPGTVHPYGEKKDYRFTLPPGARSARLVWTVRLDAPPAGSTHAMLLELNGRGITGGLTRTQPRLLNKPLTTTMASGLVIPWVRGREWRVVYSPDFELVSSAKAGSNQIAKDSPYRFVAEISDLVSFEGENVLQISHLG